MLRIYRVKAHERGFLWKHGELYDVLRPGVHARLDPLLRLRLDRASVLDVQVAHADLERIVRSGLLGDDAMVVDLKDHERALVWVDGRFSRILGPGVHALWTAFHDIRVERVDARGARLEHADQDAILAAPGIDRHLDVHTVEPGHAAVLVRSGRFVETLGPGRYAFFRGVGKTALQVVDLREQMLDIAGQDVMTADKVTLRLNAVVTYRVVDARRATAEVADHRQGLYREAQLALRAVVGGRELDALLADKEAVARELEDGIRKRAGPLGVEVRQLGIRDVVLPGEMKDLLNRVTEAKKAAEAALITRREETAAIRSQANTAKLLESSPTLMRLRELEVLERVVAKASLTVVLGEQGLTERLVKLM